MQNVIGSLVFPHLFDGEYGAAVGNYADHAPVARFVGADRAQLPVGQILADGAEVDLGFGVQDRLRKSGGFLSRHIQHRKRHALGGFPPDAVQLHELVCQVLE